jgi:hypothetical protein
LWCSNLINVVLVSTLSTSCVSSCGWLQLFCFSYMCVNFFHEEHGCVLYMIFRRHEHSKLVYGQCSARTDYRLMFFCGIFASCSYE